MPEQNPEIHRDLSEIPASEAAEFLKYKEAQVARKEAQKQRDRQFFEQQADSGLADKTAAIIESQEPKAPDSSEISPPLADRSELFLKRFEQALTDEKAKIALMNELLSDAAAGKISGHDQSVILEKLATAQAAAEQDNLAKAA